MSFQKTEAPDASPATASGGQDDRAPGERRGGTGGAADGRSSGPTASDAVVQSRHTPPHRSGRGRLLLVPIASDRSGDLRRIIAAARDRGGDTKRSDPTPQVAPSYTAPASRIEPAAGVYSLADVLRLPPLTWQIAKLLPRPGILVLGGPPKQGKSRLVRDLAYRAASGRPAMGRFVQPSARSLIYNAEGGARALAEARRAFDWIGPDALGRVGVSAQPTPNFTLRDGSVNAATFAALAQAWVGYDIVILDPLVNFHTADENNNQQMAAIMAAIRDTAEQANVGVIVVHHSAKIGDDLLVVAKAQGGGKLRGASAIHGAADSIIMAWPHRGRASLSLTFDLRYAAEEDELTVVTDRTTGRFYPQLPGNGPVDPGDFAVDHGWDVGRYREAFRASESACAAFAAARREND